MISHLTPARRGTTLVELLVVLVLVGILASLVGPAFLNTDPPPLTVGRLSAELSRAAIAHGRDTTFVRSIGGHVVVLTARPDGVVFSDSAGHHAWWVSGVYGDTR
jgi:prepilin-type N-terminal cleavage/methylation domain-containing protein